MKTVAVVAAAAVAGTAVAAAAVAGTAAVAVATAAVVVVAVATAVVVAVAGAATKSSKTAKDSPAVAVTRKSAARGPPHQGRGLQRHPQDLLTASQSAERPGTAIIPRQIGGSFIASHSKPSIPANWPPFGGLLNCSQISTVQLADAQGNNLQPTSLTRKRRMQRRSPTDKPDAQAKDATTISNRQA